MSSIIKGNINWANQEGIVKPDKLPSKGESIPDDEKFNAINDLYKESKLLRQKSGNLYEVLPTSELSSFIALLDSANHIINNMSRELAYKIQEEGEVVFVTKKKKK
jgi:hypothetical protein